MISYHTSLSRARGCLFGHIAGDSLGGLVEFQSAESIARFHPQGVRRLMDGGHWNIIAGQPTDDGEMMLALARAMIVRGEWNQQAVAQAYVDWFESGPFDIGGTTTRAMIRLQHAPLSLAVEDPASQANGALMRAAPIGIRYAGYPRRAAYNAIRDARLTHNSEICTALNGAYVAAIAAMIAAPDGLWEIKPSMMADVGLQAARFTLRHQPAALVLLAQAEAGQFPEDYMRTMGWVGTAFVNAFAHLAHCHSLEEAVIATVAQGGDTDTNAAICGALLGAAQGIGAVPDQWGVSILKCRPDAESDTCHPRPEAYWPCDIDVLSRDLFDVSPIAARTMPVPMEVGP